MTISYAGASESAAADLLRRTPLVDGHNDLPWALRHRTERDLTQFDFDREQPTYQTDLLRLRAGRVGAQFWSVYVPADTTGPRATIEVIEQIHLVRMLCARYPEHLELVETAKQVTGAFAAGRIASLLGAEGGTCIDGSIGLLFELRRLGVRYLTLTHSRNVGWADSATDVPDCGGLTGFGRDVVRAMNAMGMIVDLSHVAESTMHAVLDVAAEPVLFTHSSARALVDNPRNVPDAVLRRLPDNGGVCMVTFVPAFVCDDPSEATLSHVADHMEHVRDVAGVAHIGIGGDFDGAGAMPRGLGDVSRYPALLAELTRRGWSDLDLAAVAGGNALRVLAAADRRSATC